MSQVLPIGLLICLGSLAVGSATASAAHARDVQTLTVQRGDRAAVRMPEKPTASEQFAADELKAYLTRMLELAWVEVDDQPAVIFDVGRTAKGIPLSDTFDSAIISRERDGYAIAVNTNSGANTNATPPNITLVGGSDRGTVYAVYAFLEQWGCRFFAPGDDGEIVPTLDRASLDHGTTRALPHHIQREIDGGAMPPYTQEQMVDWSVKNRLNRRFAVRFGQLRDAYPDDRSKWFAWDVRGGRLNWQWICHNFHFMIPPKLFDEHPEYFALYNGQRVPMGTATRPYYGGGNLCTTHPEVIDRLATFTQDWFDDNPEGSIVPIWPGDGAIKWCEHDACQALGGVNFAPGDAGSMSRRMVVLVNEIARRVAKTHPDRLVMLPAYANYIDPVEDIALEPNVIVQYCYHGDYAHGPYDKANESSRKQMETYASMAPGRMGVWEYFLIGDYHATEPVPVILPLIYRIRDTAKFYQDIDARYYFTQATTAYQPYNPLVFYATARYAWDPGLDADALIDDYCAKSFGPAGDAMAAYYKAIEAAASASDWRPTMYADVASPSPKVFSESLWSQIDELLDQAEAAVADDSPQAARLVRVRESHRYTKANVNTQTLAGLDGDQAWRLQRGRDFWTVNADGADVDPVRFQGVVQHMIDTGQFTAASQRIAFRALKRDEPVVSIRSKHAAASVVPGIGGRIVSLSQPGDKSGDNWNYLHDAPAGDQLERIGETYFNYGGYEEYIGRGFAGEGWETAFKTRDEDRSTSSVTMATETDRFRLTRAVTAADNRPAAMIRSVLVNTSPATATSSIRAHPLFRLGDDARRVKLLLKLDGDTIVTTTVAAEHDGLSKQPAGVWGVVDPDTGRWLMNRFDPRCATGYVFKAENNAYFNLELFGEMTSLAPGESFVLEHEYHVGGGGESELRKAMQAATAITTLAEPVDELTANAAGNLAEAQTPSTQIAAPAGGKKTMPLSDSSDVGDGHVSDPAADAVSAVAASDTPELNAIDNARSAPATAVNVALVGGRVGQAGRFTAETTLDIDREAIGPRAGTVMLWVRRDVDKSNADGPTAKSASAGFLFGVGRNSPQWLVLGVDGDKAFLLSKSGRGEFHQGDNYYLNLSAGRGDWPAGRWRHLAFTWIAAGRDRSVAQIYIDGSLVGDRYNATLGAIDISQPAAIGRSSANTRLRFHGDIDELTVSRRPLSAAEIRAAYTAGAHGLGLRPGADTLLSVTFDDEPITATRKRVDASQTEDECIAWAAALLAEKTVAAASTSVSVSAPVSTGNPSPATEPVMTAP